MAATDQYYRNQKTLNIIFAITCVLTLVVTLWMLWADYNKPFKSVQRDFRDVETLVSERTMLARLPEPEALKTQLEKVKAAQKALAEAEEKVKPRRQELTAERDRANEKFQRIKADLDSVASYRDIEAEHVGHARGSARDAHQKQLTAYEERLAELRKQLADAQKELDDVDRKFAEDVTAKVKPAEDALTTAQEELKRLTDNFMRLAKVTAEKRWKAGDTFRDLPILDGFAPPTKIQQITLNELPIDYGGFMDVTRYDRCTSCHLGVEKGNYTPEMLRALAVEPDLQKLARSHRILRDILAAGEELPFDLDDIHPDKLKQVKPIELTPGQVTMYAAHPRLDLFVDSNSPHPVERFGCTICHGGQGSATDFGLASHTPNDAKQKERWMKAHSEDDPDSYHWHSNHYWDFPMNPRRFVESSCLKCHHQVTDLVRQGNRQEAPKLTEGFQLVRDNGCFGCHEISGQKGGRPVGPDLRIEPTPPLEWLTPSEQARVRGDAQNPPGDQRKVGPGLRRIAEKTNSDWMAKWIKTPRGFREDTRMPHFYGLSTNSKDVLPEDQQQFPDAEIYAITFYLMSESNLYLGGQDSTRKMVAAEVDRLQKELIEKGLTAKQLKDLSGWTRRLGDLLLMASPAEASRVNEMLADVQRAQDLFVEARKQTGMEAAEAVKKAGEELLARTKDLNAFKPPALPQLAERRDEPAEARDKRLWNGRRLFQERGCMACHSHGGTAQPMETGGQTLPGFATESNFGPDLSRVTAKLGNDKVTARRWLVQWLVNPNLHSPRTRMPITQLNVGDASDIADWLLSQKVDDWSIHEEDQPEAGANSWAKVKVEQPKLDIVRQLAVSYLKGTAIGRTDAEAVAQKGLEKAHKERLALPDADEWLLDPEQSYNKEFSHEQKLWRYVGKKAMSRLGCFGCHDVPGFETAKPIGTPLNDWGKKDAERLAFEDSVNYVNQKYHTVPLREDPKGGMSKDWKVGPEGQPPYEKSFADALKGHSRDGFLHLKLSDPRSFDHNRQRTWEDRLRMPQFRFARARKKGNEEEAGFARRRDYEEARAREAVMTFVLGLVAEPVPLKYVNQPKGDRLDVVKGAHVVDKFNCASCHHLEAGTIDFTLGKTTAQREEVLGLLNPKAEFNPADHVFLQSNAWMGASQPSDRLLAHAVHVKPSEEIENALQVYLTEAMRYTTPEGETKNIPAGELILLPNGVISRQTPAHGGTWTDQMEPWLAKRGVAAFNEEKQRRTVLPPPLLRQGERIKPQWLYQFFLDPQTIRPNTILRMPKFNMSPEEAQALARYFSAKARLHNPGVGMSDSFIEVPQRDPNFWREKTARYVKGMDEKTLKQRLDALAPIWEAYLKDETTDKERQLTRAKANIEAAKDPAVKTALEQERDQLEKDLKAARDRLEKKDFKELNERWMTEEAYASDAYRLLTDKVKGRCTQCHSIGNIRIQGENGPNLEQTADRLRPEWVKQWIANPRRLFSYDPVMIANFQANEKLDTRRPVTELFHGIGDDKDEAPLAQRQRIEALRDVLMDLQRISNLPVNRYSGK